jgi:hypothetical protein
VALERDFSLVKNSQICLNLAHKGVIFPVGNLPTYFKLIPSSCLLVVVLE